MRNSQHDCTLACLSNAPTYGATMARVDNFEEKQSTSGNSVAVHECFMLTAFATEQGILLCPRPRWPRV